MTGHQPAGRVALAGRAVVATLLVAAAAVHLPVIAAYLGPETWAGLVLGVVAVAAVAPAIALLVTDRPGVLLAAAAWGALAMGAFIVTWVFAAPRAGGMGGWTAVWGIAVLVVDSLVVRAAVFTLRRRARLGAG